MLWSSLNFKINHFLKLALSYLALEVKTENFVNLLMFVVLPVLLLIIFAFYI